MGWGDWQWETWEQGRQPKITSRQLGWALVLVTAALLGVVLVVLGVQV